MKRNYLLIAVFLIFTFSCNNKHICDCFDTEGEFTIDTVFFEEFNKLQILDVFTLYLYQDTVNYAIVKANENFLKNIDFYQENNILTVENNHNCVWTKPEANGIIVELHFNKLAEIEVAEPSILISENEIIGDEFGIIFKCHIAEAELKLNTNTFYFWNTNGGKLVLSGITNELKIWNYTLCNVDASNLDANNIIIDNFSLGDCYINVNKELYARIYNLGNIYYSGNPDIMEIELNDNSGRLIKMD